MKEKMMKKLVRYLEHCRENNLGKLIQIHNRYCEAVQEESPIGWTVWIGEHLAKEFTFYGDVKTFLMRVADGEFNPRDCYYIKDEDKKLVSMNADGVKSIIPITAIAEYWLEDMPVWRDEEDIRDFLDKTLIIESDWDWDAVDDEKNAKTEMADEFAAAIARLRRTTEELTDKIYGGIVALNDLINKALEENE